MLWLGAMGVRADCGPVLIVDDDAGFREFVSVLLERAGFASVAVADGEQGLECARGERPALVLLDVGLPGISGYQLCRELRDACGDALAIIFVSGTQTDRLDRVAGLLLGADDYLSKPFQGEELLARVRQHLARSQQQPPRARESSSLSPREREILALLAAGLDQRAIAARLVISPKTVATHIQHLLEKLGVGSRAQAVAFAHQHGLAENGRGAAAPRPATSETAPREDPAPLTTARSRTHSGPKRSSTSTSSQPYYRK
jgi:DNA-binding NarL/FixJ family response regulator